MKNTLLKAIWCIPAVIMSVIYALLGLVLCVTVIGIPFGKQYFKLAKLCLNPFDAMIGDLTANPTQRATRNVVFNILFGIVFTAISAVVGLVLCVTIIGIPFGKQCLKLAKVSLKPFNYAVV